MSIRTNLATELENKYIKDRKKEIKIGDISVEFTEISEDFSSFRKNKKYCTIFFGNINYITDFSDIENALKASLQELLGKAIKSFLIVGLGNREITSDCIGPYTCEKILATRHIEKEFSKKIGLPNLKSVAVLAPGVLGKTGMESSEIVSAVVKEIKPDAVIVIDALCASNTKNLFSLIQLTDSGISPGSGVNNSRKELSYETLGVPTVAIGIPTVINAKALATHFSGENPENELILTPKDTDLLSHRISEILALSLNIFLQPDTDREILLNLV